MYLPFVGASLEAFGIIVEKRLLRNTGITYKNYTVFGFLAIVFLMLPFLYWIWHLDHTFFHWLPIALFTSVVITAFFANILTFYSLKRKSISEFEPLWLMQPLFTILLAVLLYRSEREWILVGLAFIASIALVAMHVKKHHLLFDRYLVAGISGSFLFGLELVLSKPLLTYFSPFTFYFFRCLFVFVIAFVVYRPRLRINKKIGAGIALVSLTWILYRAIIYYGYDTYGIVYTTLLFILSPVLLLIFAVVFLKEKLTLRHIITNLIILGCVIGAIIVEKFY